MLADVNISRDITASTQRGLEAADLSVERTLRELARIAFADPRKLFRPNGEPIPVHELDDDTAAAVASMEVDQSGKTKVRLHPKNDALASALRHLGLFERDNRQNGTNLALQINFVGSPGPPPVVPGRITD